MEDIKPRDNWYVIHTATGKEDDLVESIYHMAEYYQSMGYADKLFALCFYMTYDDVWRYQGRSYIDEKKLFPGYVFLVTDAPERMNEIIRSIPQFARLMSEEIDGSRCFISVLSKEADFLYNLIADNDEYDYCVHRSYVIRSGNKIVDAYGGLKPYLDDIVQADYKKRRVIVEKTILGQKRRIKFSIYDDNDCRIEGIKPPISKEDNDTRVPYHVGDAVWIDMEGYDDRPYVITRVQEKKCKVYVAVELFEREVEMEVGIERIV